MVPARPTLPENLALDEALLIAAEETGREWLRLWEWPALAVVLGAGGKLAEEADEAACGRDDVPILRRSSGGGTVLLGPGCLLFSLVLCIDSDPLLAQITSSYRRIMDRLARALAPFAPGIAHAGTSDLAWRGRKVSGNSQQRKRRAILHHGTVLYDFDLTRIGRYLKSPPRQPEYRQGRAHADFVANLPATRKELEAALIGEWGLPLFAARDDMSERERVATLTVEKYDNAAWVRRR